MGAAPPRTSALSDRVVSRILRAAGCVNLTALLFAFGPRRWLEDGHRLLLGDSFPEEPVAEYLARSASLLYAFHGLLLIYAAGDVRKYSGWLRLYAGLVVFAGFAFTAVDLISGMPAWWAWSEGGTLLVGGSLMLWLLRGRRG